MSNDNKVFWKDRLVGTEYDSEKFKKMMFGDFTKFDNEFVASERYRTIERAMSRLRDSYSITGLSATDFIVDEYESDEEGEEKKPESISQRYKDNPLAGMFE